MTGRPILLTKTSQEYLDAHANRQVLKAISLVGESQQAVGYSTAQVSRRLFFPPSFPSKLTNACYWLPPHLRTIVSDSPVRHSLCLERPQTPAARHICTFQAPSQRSSHSRSRRPEQGCDCESQLVQGWGEGEREGERGG